MITIETTTLNGVYLVKPFVHQDKRGNFYETYNEKEYRKKNDKEKEDYWNRSSVVKKIILIHGKFQYSPDIQMGNKIHIELPL